MKTAVITLDIINDICHPDGELAHHVARIQQNNIIENINKVLVCGREREVLVIHVRLGFRENYQDGSMVSPLFKTAKSNQRLKISSWGSQFCDILDRDDHDVEIIKHRVSAFYGTDLDLILRANKIAKLVLTGVATNNAVELTAREAHDRDYFVTVVSDATETANDAEKNASLHFLSRIAEVTTTELLCK